MREQYKPISDLIRPVLGSYKSIDWDSLKKSVVEELRRTDKKLTTYEEEYWCLDMILMKAIMDGNITKENVSNYVEDNLEEYVEEIIQNPMYEIHATLIKEAYEAYKHGLYKLCIMPLFAAFEHVIAFWFKGKITKEAIAIRSNPNVWGLYKKIEPEKYYASDIEVEQIKKVFAISVLRTFKNTFTKGSEGLGRNLNRNSIAHGFHDYDSLTNQDALKLFQLLKSSLILQYVGSKIVADS
ncbi:hypothetical protein RW25_05055 [Bacillus sp. L_1B0_8]|nr:hypothetical protein RT27_13255 [Bacillus sp. L_1B0_5]KIQ91834.1 hypothetical protein RW25_05055 [Bacillus sp. L_1B0_8]